MRKALTMSADEMTTAMNTDRKDMTGILLRHPRHDPTRAAGMWLPEIRQRNSSQFLRLKKLAVSDLAPTLL
jgi:hypothetical protein